MVSKPKSDPKQSERFIEMAKEIGADETKEGADRAFKKIVPSKKPVSKNLRKGEH